MKQQKEAITRICAYCQHAKIVAATETKNPPFSVFLSYPDNEGATLLCPYKKQISPDSKCFRFRFDPLKYRPKPQPTPILLDEDGVL